jgi:hypothetical protein
VAGDVIDIDSALGSVGASVIAGLTAGRDHRWHLRFDTGRSAPCFSLRTAPPAAGRRRSPCCTPPTSTSTRPRLADSIPWWRRAPTSSPGRLPLRRQRAVGLDRRQFRVKHRDVRRRQVQRLLRSVGAYAIYDVTRRATTGTAASR